MTTDRMSENDFNGDEETQLIDQTTDIIEKLRSELADKPDLLKSAIALINEKQENSVRTLTGKAQKAVIKAKNATIQLLKDINKLNNPKATVLAAMNADIDLIGQATDEIADIINEISDCEAHNSFVNTPTNNHTKIELTKQPTKTFASILKKSIEKQGNSATVIVKANTDVDCLKKFKETIDLTKCNAGLKAMKVLSKDKVLLVCPSSKDKDILTEQLKKSTEIQVQQIKAPNLNIIIRQVNTEMLKADIINGIYNQNNPINDSFTRENFERQILYYKEQKRATTDRKNIILKVTKKLYKILIQHDKIKIGHQYLKSAPYIDIPRCYKCLAYGHVARHCTPTTNSLPKCLNCLEDHDQKQCPNERKPETHKCLNCSRLTKFKNENRHHTFSIDCPALIEARRIYMQKVKTYLNDGTD